jgi:hypothetical protein
VCIHGCLAVRAWQLIAIKPHEGKGRIWGLLGIRIAKHQFIL